MRIPSTFSRVAAVTGSRALRCSCRAQPGSDQPSADRFDAADIVSELLQSDTWEKVSSGTGASSDTDQQQTGKRRSRKRRSRSGDETLAVLRRRSRNMSKPWFLLVVAAAVYNEASDQVLIAQRPNGKRHQGLWEFPGGKLERGESPEEAIVREIREELDLELDPDALERGTFETVEYAPRKYIMLLFFVCRKYSGEAKGLEGQKFQWVDVSTLLDRDDFVPADDNLSKWFIRYLRREPTISPVRT